MKWYVNNSFRFEMEKKTLELYHPGTKIIIEDGVVRVLKAFRIYQKCYLLKGVFPKDFPYSPMHVFIERPALRDIPPHQYFGGRLCLHGPNDVGPETTAKVYLDWAVQWILTYERWLKGEPWPDRNVCRL